MDRVPSFCAMVEDRIFNEVLGHPLISQEKMMTHPLARFFLSRWGTKLSKNLFQAELNRTFEKRIKAQVELGFDSLWAILDETVTVIDHKTIKEVVDSIQEAGLKDIVKVFIGGACTSEQLKEEMGADGYGETAVAAVKIFDRLAAVA
ncbi:MAG: hypothetical protein ACOZF0_13865 [Thermodesulfobacteriota bacterium]